MIAKIVTKLKRLFNLANKGIFTIRSYGLVVFLKKGFWYVGNRLSRQHNRSQHRVMGVDEVFYRKLPNITPVKHIMVDYQKPRINIITDSIEPRSLLGGVATALILATQFANKYKLSLRIITRECSNNPEHYENFLKLMGQKKPENVEYFSDYDRIKKNFRSKLEVSQKDIFLTTSWWSTFVTKEFNLQSSIFYILQEVESFFYPNSDEQYFCEQIMESAGIKYIVNSKLLWDYYDKNNKNITNNGIYFEPSFPKDLYYPGKSSFEKKEKYNLFFYSRPKNPRNLFYLGIKLLDQAIIRGIIDTDKWVIHFAGSDVPKIKFSDGSEPIMLGQMSWDEYKNFVKKIDLGFCLMYTPHPSYPPLDIVASGGVVLTNQYLNKKNLNYSDNILCEELNEEQMLKGFKKAMNLAADAKNRKINFEKQGISRDWEGSFEKVIKFMKDNLDESIC